MAYKKSAYKIMQIHEMLMSHMIDLMYDFLDAMVFGCTVTFIVVTVFYLYFYKNFI